MLVRGPQLSHETRESEVLPSFSSFFMDWHKSPHACSEEFSLSHQPDLPCCEWVSILGVCSSGNCFPGDGDRESSCQGKYPHLSVAARKLGGDKSLRDQIASPAHMPSALSATRCSKSGTTVRFASIFHKPCQSSLGGQRVSKGSKASLGPEIWTGLKLISAASAAFSFLDWEQRKLSLTLMQDNWGAFSFVLVFLMRLFQVTKTNRFSSFTQEPSHSHTVVACREAPRSICLLQELFCSVLQGAGHSDLRFPVVCVCMFCHHRILSSVV